MPWSEPPQQKSYVCNGQLLKTYRQRRKWTQEQLAAECDLSVRVIAKAEGGGSLHPDTLDRIAAALSEPDDGIHPEDLASNPEAIVREFLGNLKEHRGDVVPNSRHLLSDDIVYIMPGDPDALPFAGEHLGVEAADRSVRAFFDMVEITDPDEWTTEMVSCHGQEVIAVQLVRGQLKGLSEVSDKPPPPTLVVYRMVVQRGKIVVFDEHYPAEMAKENVRLQALVRDYGKSNQ